MKGVTKTVLAYVTDGGLGALIWLFFYRIASPADYGYIGFLATSAYFFAIFSLLGSDYSLIYALAKRDRFLSRGILSIALVLPLIGAALDFLVTFSWASCLLAYLAALAFIGTSSLVGRRMYNTLIVLAIVKRSIQAAGMIYLYYTIGATGAVLGIVLSMIPGTLITLSLMASLKPSLTGIYGVIKEIFALNGTVVMITASLYSDKVLLGHILTYEQFSGYYLAFQAILLFNALSDATMRSVTSELISEHSIDAFSKFFLLSAMILAPVATILSRPFIPIFLGSKVAEYTNLIAITGFYLPAAVPLSFSVGYLTYRGLKRFMLYSSVILLLLRSLLPVAFALLWGVMGALIGFIVATATVGISLSIYTRVNREKRRSKRNAMAEMEIVRERDNKLLHRREYVVRVDHVGAPTPSREVLRSKLIHFLNAPDDRLVVKRIVQRFGRQDALVKVHVYYTIDDMKEIEDEKTLKLNGFLQEAQA